MDRIKTGEDNSTVVNRMPDDAYMGQTSRPEMALNEQTRNSNMAKIKQ